MVRPVVIVASVVTTVIIVAVGNPKDGANSDDQSDDSHDVVDDRGNVAADGNGVEGFSGVPLLSRSRVTECKSLHADIHNHCIMLVVHLVCMCHAQKYCNPRAHVRRALIISDACIHNVIEFPHAPLMVDFLHFCCTCTMHIMNCFS